ncbi:MAG TPA: MFS transporter [Jiangellaceae bacterium]|nr:MFS transporter [Jiangellaceae bacterium]
MDGRLGVHRRAGDRGLPGRWRTSRRSRGTAAHGAGRGGRSPGGAAGGRGRRERVLVLVSTLRALATGAAAVIVSVGGPTPMVYALAVVSSVAVTLYRPAHSALLPSLCRTGYELASANVVRGLLDSVATLIGPLLAAVLLKFTSVTVVFAVASGASLWAAGLMLRVRYDAPPRPSATKRPHLVAEAAEGIRACRQVRWCSGRATSATASTWSSPVWPR